MTYTIICQTTDVFGYKFHVLMGPASLDEILEWFRDRDGPIIPGTYHVTNLNPLRPRA